MSLSNQLKSSKDTIQNSLYIGKARWEGLVEKVSQAEREQETDLLGQIMKLDQVHTVPEEGLNKYTEYALKPTRTDLRNSSGGVWEQIRRATPAIDFIGRYIELTPTPTGGVGYCPFHEDRHQSFGVHAKGNYWHCFAGCGGGSIIDFWMNWKNCDLGQAVNELKVMLLGDFE